MSEDSSLSSVPMRAIDVPAHVPLVALSRGGRADAPSIESVHYGSVMAGDAQGRVCYCAGDPQAQVFARSAFKLLFAVGMLRAGLQVSDPELAVVCASHSAAPQHLEQVRAVLARHGLSEQDLRNTPGVPLGVMERRAFTRAGQVPDRLHQNCSGKHAAMLATCVSCGWDTDSYLSADHPLQEHLRTTVEDLAGYRIDPARVTRDGCGAQVYPLPLEVLVRAFARLTASDADEACRAVVRAMSRYPVLAGGEGRDSTRLMQAIPGAVAKDGAEGFFVVVLPGGLACAVTIADGAMRACVPALTPALRRLGIDDAACAALAPSPVLGWGEPVGRMLLIAGHRER